ncbi:unnamed protein product, partial [Mesorhabditis spiculigera]
MQSFKPSAEAAAVPVKKATGGEQQDLSDDWVRSTTTQTFKVSAEAIEAPKSGVVEKPQQGASSDFGNSDTLKTFKVSAEAIEAPKSGVVEKPRQGASSDFGNSDTLKSIERKKHKRGVRVTIDVSRRWFANPDDQAFKGLHMVIDCPNYEPTAGRDVL